MTSAGTAPRTAPPSLGTTLGTVAELVRAPAALSVPGDAVAGAAAAGTLCARTAGLAASSVLLYWGGMAANDWADRDVDAVERPGRPIPSGRMSSRAALAVALGLTGAGVAVAGAVGGRRALAVAVPLAATVWAYDGPLKDTAAGPVAMAACRGLDVLLGAGPGPLRRAAPTAAVVTAHTYLLTLLSRREVHGASAGLPAATLAATAALATAVVLPGPPTPTARALAAWAPAAALTAGYAATFGRAQLTAAGDPSPKRVRAAVGAGITGLPWLQGALTARAGAPLAGLAVAAAAPLGRRLARRVSPT